MNAYLVVVKMGNVNRKFNVSKVVQKIVIVRRAVVDKSIVP